jgi:TRAP-type transport system periplasmic protein
MKRRSFVQGAATAAAAATLGTPLAALAQQTVTLKFHTFMAPQSQRLADMHKPWMDKVEKESGGRIKFEAYPAMQLGGTPCSCTTRPRRRRRHRLDAAGQHRRALPAHRGVRAAVHDDERRGHVQGLLGVPADLAADEFKDTQVLALQRARPRACSQRKSKQIRRPTTCGLKVRGPTRRSPKMLAAVGATPVGMPLPQIPDALSKGVIDGAVIPWEVVPSVKVHELTKFHSEFDPRAARCTPRPS